MHCPQLFASWFKLQTSIVETFCASERRLLVLRMPKRDKASDGAKAAVADGAKPKSAAVAAPRPEKKTQYGAPLEPGVLAEIPEWFERYPMQQDDGRPLAEESHVEQMIAYIGATATEAVTWKKIKKLVPLVWDQSTSQDIRSDIVKLCMEKHLALCHDTEAPIGWLFGHAIRTLYTVHNYTVLMHRANKQGGQAAAVAAGPSGSGGPEKELLLGAPSSPTSPIERKAIDPKAYEELKTKLKLKQEEKRAEKKKGSAGGAPAAVAAGPKEPGRKRKQKTPSPPAPPPSRRARTERTRRADSCGRRGRSCGRQDGREAEGGRERPTTVVLKEATKRKQTSRPKNPSPETSQEGSADWGGSDDARRSRGTPAKEDEERSEEEEEDSDRSLPSAPSPPSIPSAPPGVPPPPPPAAKLESRSRGTLKRERSPADTSGPPLPSNFIAAAYVLLPGVPRADIEHMLANSPAHVSLVLQLGRDDEISGMLAQLRSGRNTHRAGWEDFMDKKFALEMPSDSMHVLLHRGHCVPDTGGSQLLTVECMSNAHEGQRIVFACHRIRFLTVNDSRSRGSHQDDPPAVAVGFIMAPPDEEILDKEIVDAIGRCVINYDMKLLLGTLPCDKDKAITNMLGRMDCKGFCYQSFLVDTGALHLPVYGAAFGWYKALCSEFALVDMSELIA